MRFQYLPQLLTCFSFLSSFPLIAEPSDPIYQRGYLSIEDAHKSIELQDGYRLELVLSDPNIQEPVAMAWDGNGALYVVEMRTYMQDADATGEQEPHSRISRHEDTNGDGIYDKHSVFIDNLMLPRMILPLDDRIMVGMTNTGSLWTYRDSDGDGVADKKERIYKGRKRGNNMEHQPSGLIWNLDNWIYLTYESVRYRFTDGKLKVERIPRGGGQWGMGQDDNGRIYYSSAGGERPAFFFQQPIAYGAVNLKGQLADDFHKVYPIADVPDVQGGPNRVNKRGGLNAFTGCAGQGIYRGDRLPSDLKGNLLLPEPVGRLIRRCKVTRTNGKTVLSNAYQKNEFIRSRDINFRPLWATTSPDGGMMFIDMHRGIIQQGNWTRPKSYLRGVIDKWGLAKNINKGRIYRLVHDSYKADKKPNMLNESTEQLVAHLSHPNGWWRDTAQKLILLRQDRKTVAPALAKLVKTGSSGLGRVHALWTLEGMSTLSPELIATALEDKSSIVRTTAIRVSEPLLKQGNIKIVQALINSTHLQSDIEMVIQLLNSIEASRTENSDLRKLNSELFRDHVDNEAVAEIKEIIDSAVLSRKKTAELKLQNKDFALAMERGKQIYQQLCFSCHANNGQGVDMPGVAGRKLAPSFVNNPRLSDDHSATIRTLLNGLQGPLDGKEYEGLMVAMGSNDDQWIADITTFVRNSFGNKSHLTRSQDVAKIRKAHAKRKTPWTQSELEAFKLSPLKNRQNWKLTASHGSQSLAKSIDGDTNTYYSTFKSQMAGMWLQIELPHISQINQIILETAKLPYDHPGGYEVVVSLDGKNWSEPVSIGKGSRKLTKIQFPLVEAKFIRIIQTAVRNPRWAIHELNIVGKEL